MGIAYNGVYLSVTFLVLLIAALGSYEADDVLRHCVGPVTLEQYLELSICIPIQY